MHVIILLIGITVSAGLYGCLVISSNLACQPLLKLKCLPQIHASYMYAIINIIVMY